MWTGLERPSCPLSRWCEPQAVLPVEQKTAGVAEAVDRVTRVVDVDLLAAGTGAEGEPGEWPGAGGVPEGMGPPPPRLPSRG